MILTVMLINVLFHKQKKNFNEEMNRKQFSSTLENRLVVKPFPTIAEASIRLRIKKRNVFYTYN